MKTKLLQAHGERTYAVVFDKGDEVMAGLKAFAQAQQLGGSHFTAIGAFKSATLGFFDRDKKDYKKIPVQEQVEVLTLVGNITLDDDEPKIHAHVVLGRADGSTVGGHVMEAQVWPTLEVIVIESAHDLRRRTDPETELPLIDIQPQEEAAHASA